MLNALVCSIFLLKGISFAAEAPTFATQYCFPLWVTTDYIFCFGSKISWLYCKHLPPKYLLSPRSGWKMQPQDPGIWPDWKPRRCSSPQPESRRKSLSKLCPPLIFTYQSGIQQQAAGIWRLETYLSWTQQAAVNLNNSSIVSTCSWLYYHTHGELFTERLRPEGQKGQITIKHADRSSSACHFTFPSSASLVQ